MNTERGTLCDEGTTSLAEELRRNPGADYFHVFPFGGRWFVQFSASAACPGRPSAMAAEYRDCRAAEVRAARMVDLYKRRVKGAKARVLVHSGSSRNLGPTKHRAEHESDMARAHAAARRGHWHSALYYGGRAAGHKFSAGDLGPKPYNPTPKELGDNPGQG